MSVTFRKDRNKWQASWGSGPERQRPLFDSKREADAWVASCKTSGADAITIDDAIKIYFGDVSPTKSRSSESNEKRYFNLMFHFLTRVRNKVYLRDVKYSDMVSFQKWLGEPRVYDGKPMNWAPATVNRAFNSIKDLFVYFVRDEKIPSSPCDYLGQLQHEENSRRPMTADEFALAFKAAPEWFKPAMGFIHLTASAPSSVARFKKSDINFDKNEIVITRRKGAKGRWRRITQPMTEALRHLLENLPAAKHGFVFSNEAGEPLTAEWCSRVGNRAIKAAGLDGVVLYCARHALASDLTDANVSLEVVRQLMGHSNIRTTQRYAKPKQETLANALKLVRDENVAPNCHQNLEDVAQKAN